MESKHGKKKYGPCAVFRRDLKPRQYIWVSKIFAAPVASLCIDYHLASTTPNPLTVYAHSSRFMPKGFTNGQSERLSTYINYQGDTS
jgi:hypothetical protein